MIFRLLCACVLTALEGYLLGSILFGVVISKVFFHDDVRNHGSGNGGMTNVLRTFGKAAAAGTALGDVGKSVAAVLIGQWLFDVLLSGGVASSLLLRDLLLKRCAPDLRLHYGLPALSSDNAVGVAIAAKEGAGWKRF